MKIGFLEDIRNWYGRWERPVSSLSLIGGFVFDAIVLKRIDMFWENFWIIVHLLIVAVFIVLVNSRGHAHGDEGDPSKPNFWYVNILQFFFGGLLSTYLVFYFRSSDLFTSWPFILILALAFWANESLKRRFVRLSFQISLFFLSLFSFAIYFLPVVLHSLGQTVFLWSGVISLCLILIFVYIIRIWNRERFEQSKKIVLVAVSGVFILMNVLYFTNIIPPIPLSLKNTGVFHSIKRNQTGNYEASLESSNWSNWFKLYDDVHVRSSDPIYVYSAVFSPSNLNVGIFHKWMRYDNNLDKWKEEGTTHLDLVGGREDGFRTYSVRNNLSNGRWKVVVETQSGHVLGQIRFNVINGVAPASLAYKEL